MSRRISPAMSPAMIRSATHRRQGRAQVEHLVRLVERPQQDRARLHEKDLQPGAGEMIRGLPADPRVDEAVPPEGGRCLELGLVAAGDVEAAPVGLAHHRPAAPPQHPRHLGHHLLRPLDVLQRAVDPHRVEPLAGQTGPARVALDDADARLPGQLLLRAGYQSTTAVEADQLAAAGAAAACAGCRSRARSRSRRRWPWPSGRARRSTAPCSGRSTAWRPCMRDNGPACRPRRPGRRRESRWQDRSWRPPAVQKSAPDPIQPAGANGASSGSRRPPSNSAVANSPTAGASVTPECMTARYSPSEPTGRPIAGRPPAGVGR